jgi:hypothetical protein
MYVHGGRLEQGGGRLNGIADKVTLFRDDMGYVFVSTNYRLSADNGYRHPDREFPNFTGNGILRKTFTGNLHVVDVAAAIAHVLSAERSQQD